jgi:Mn-containing catalase
MKRGREGERERGREGEMERKINYFFQTFQP